MLFLWTRLGQKTEKISLATAKAWEARFTQEMKNSGLDLKVMKDSERVKIKAVAEPFWKEWAQNHGPDAKRLLELNSGKK